MQLVKFNRGTDRWRNCQNANIEIRCTIEQENTYSVQIDRETDQRYSPTLAMQCSKKQKSRTAHQPQIVRKQLSAITQHAITAAIPAKPNHRPTTDHESQHRRLAKTKLDPWSPHPRMSERSENRKARIKQGQGYKRCMRYPPPRAPKPPIFDRPQAKTKTK